MSLNDAPGFTREGPSANEMRVIGVEFTATDINGVEHELEMFACTHTMIEDYRYPKRFRITLHTSIGDITVRAPLRPGQYQMF
jgi:hypothetical protein